MHTLEYEERTTQEHDHNHSASSIQSPRHQSLILLEDYLDTLRSLFANEASEITNNSQRLTPEIKGRIEQLLEKIQRAEHVLIEEREIAIVTERTVQKEMNQKPSS